MADHSRRQRIGAYAVAVDPERILLTRLSPSGYPVGHWNLPGGGLDHGETPHDALHRELYEETGLVASSARLVDVHSVHEVEPTRDDGYDDYHGIHIIFVVEVDPTAQLTIIDEGGSTDLAQWVSFDEARQLPLLPAVEHVLDHLDSYLPA